MFWNDIARERPSREAMNIMEDYILENSEHPNQPLINEHRFGSSSNNSENELNNIMQRTLSYRLRNDFNMWGRQ